MIEIFPFLFLKRSEVNPQESVRSFELDNDNKCLFDINILDGVNSVFYQTEINEKRVFNLGDAKQKAIISVIPHSSNDMFVRVDRYNEVTEEWSKHSSENPFEIRYSDLADNAETKFKLIIEDKPR